MGVSTATIGDKLKPRIPDDRLSSGEQLAQFATELTDEEIGKVTNILYMLQRKYSHRANTAENLDQLRDEALTRLAEINVLATVDPAPCFYGEPPVVELIGKVDPNPEGFDHEVKRKEVLRANELGEDYRGQKERYNKRKKS